MRRLIVFLLFLIVSVWVGMEIMRHPGYLLLVYHHWMVQMPLWFVALSLIVIFSLFYVLIVSIDQCQFLWFRFKQWLDKRSVQRAYSKTQHGLSLLIEGRWKKSERLLLAGVNQSVEPLINYLAAAKAAQEQAALDRRDKHIQAAYDCTPNANVAIGLTQAELEMEQHQWEHALATLNHLRQLSPHHPRVIKLLEKAYTRLNDWTQLQALLPTMRKAKIVTAEQAEIFEKNIYCELFRQAAHRNLTEIRQLWNQVPRYLKKHPDVVCAYVTLLARHAPVTGVETTREMEALIRKTLKHHWQPELVNIYGTLNFSSLNNQLVIAGTWLKAYGQHPELLLLLGKLCVRVQLWGKAKDYFEKCLLLRANAEASLAYGKLLESLGEQEAALRVYRDGLGQIEMSRSENV